MSGLGDLSRTQARQRPDDAAYVCGDETLTFADVDRRASQVANALLGAGLPPQSRGLRAAKRPPGAESTCPSRTSRPVRHPA